jgi:uncharacterized protein (DUF433 family)
MDWKAHITSDPKIMHGVACFKGTRIPVSVVLGVLITLDLDFSDIR